MGKMEDLAKLLEERKRQSEQKNEDLSKIRSDWLISLRDLFSEFNKWLSPLKNRNVATIRIVKNTIAEEQLGQYEVPFMFIETLNKSITIRPIGRFIIGALGRVDISYGVKQIMLVRHNDGWKIAFNKDRGFDYLPLNEDTFTDIIMSLIS